MRKIIEFFYSDNNKQLMKNLEKYEQKEKIKFQKPKVYGQEPVKRTENNKKSIV